MRRNKAQMWFMDFVIAILIFSLVLISYYTYTTNISKKDTVVMDDLVSDSKTVASSLISPGFPDNWNANTVARIGFTDNNNRIDNAKFSEFNEINYNKSKKLLGTIYNYFLYFVNESGDTQNVEGYCGTGMGEVNITYDIKSAYYYKGPGEEEYLKSFMQNEFKADVYCERSSDCPGAILTDLNSKISSYSFVVMESPELSTGDFNSFKAAAEPYVASGGFLMLGGQLLAAQGKTMLDVTFYKIAGLSQSDKLSTVVRQDEFFNFNVADNIVFTQAYYIASAGASIIDIARFNESDIELIDILDNKIALARWEYGDGNAFFLSDFDADYFQGNFIETLKASAKKWIGAGCLPINIDNIKRGNLVRVDRLVIYKSNQIKMVLYLWN